MMQSTNYGGPTQQFDGVGNISFKLSPDDWDQTNGGLKYELHVKGPGSLVRLNLTAGNSMKPVPQRPGWVYVDTGFNGYQVVGPNVGETSSLYSFNVTVWDVNATPDDEGASSCTVTLDYRQDPPANAAGVPDFEDEEGWQDQCGENIGHVPGVGAVVTTAVQDNVTGAINTTWKVSEDDPDNDTGDFNYTVLTLVDDQGDPFFYRFTVDTLAVGEGAGSRWFSYNFSTISRVTNYVQVYDNMTHRLNGSCVYVDNGTTTNRGATVTTDVLFSASVCGNMPVPDVTLDLSGPQFPMINVANTADELGISTAVLGLLLGATLLLMAAFAGGMLAGAVGVGIGGVLGLVAAGALSLFPIWVLTLCVVGAAVVLVTTFSRGREA